MIRPLGGTRHGPPRDLLAEEVQVVASCGARISNPIFGTPSFPMENGVGPLATYDCWSHFRFIENGLVEGTDLFPKRLA